MEVLSAVRTGGRRHLGALLLASLALPAALAGLTMWLAPLRPPLPVQVLLVLALVAPMGFLLYRAAFRPVADRPPLLLLFVAVAVHYALTGLGLLFFGSEGFRTPPFVTGRWDVGVTRLSWHLLLVVALSALIMAALALFFGRSLWGQAMRGTAVSRLGARLVGVRPDGTGALAFVIATVIGALSGILIAPVTPLYYDSGFLVGLKGFIGAVMAGLASFPLAVAGALLVGLTESFASFYASPFKEAIVFLLLVPFLLWRSAVEPRSDGEHGA